LSRLTVVVSDAARTEGLRVESDGRELTPAAWSLAIPVDGGEHVVRATAPGRLPWSKTVALPDEAGAATVEIPALGARAPPPARRETGGVLIVAPRALRKATRAGRPPGSRRGDRGPARGRVVLRPGGVQRGSRDINRNDEALRDADRSTVLFVTGHRHGRSQRLLVLDVAQRATPLTGKAPGSHGAGLIPPRARRRGGGSGDI
jgi:hypothetical protein